MSNISVNTITDASGGSTASINGLTPQASNMQPFNRIINGAMTIDQRNAGAAVTTSGFVTDRFNVQNVSDGAFSAQQDSEAPVGFLKSLKVTVTTADTSLTTTQNLRIDHRIEGSNVSDLNWGTANAKVVTVSFWVRSSLTGSFSGALNNGAFNRAYPFSYTISSANTWEQKTITVAGDTTGTWVTDNGTGLNVTWSLGAGPSRTGSAGSWAASNLLGVTGQVELIGTSGATFYITGVQLEVGSTASSFAHENVGDTLQKCQRYFQKSLNQDVAAGTAADIGGIHVLSWSDGNASGISWQTVMRAAPTVTFYPTNSTSAGYVNSFGTDRVASAAYPSQRGFSFILVTSGSSINYVRFQYIATAEL